MIPRLDFLELKNRTAVKVCGFAERENLLDVLALPSPPDAIGLNFYPKSKRYLEPEGALTWVPFVAQRTTIVGVFVNESTEAILQMHESGLLHAAQLHGDESPEDCAVLMAAGIPVIKAVGVKDEESVGDLARFGTPYLLLDAYLPETFGGGGETFDWALARATVDRYPELLILLSGGLDPDNAGTAVAAVQPAAVDAASGVESAPGVKSVTKVRRFVEAVRGL